MADENLDFRITARDLASAKFATVNKNLTGMQGAASKASGALRGLGIGGFASATLGAAALAGALANGIHQAIEDETSIKRLGQALKANVPEWNGNTAAIEKRILAAQELGFSDDELRASLALLVGATHDVGEAQKLQNAAMDLARLKGIDLQTASDALIKVEGGRYRILASLGIQLGKNATKEQVLAAIQKVAAGQAEAFAKTTEGAMKAASIAFDEATESIGRQLLPVIKDLANFTRDVVAPNLQIVAIAIGAVATVIVAHFIPAIIAATVAAAPLVAALAVIGATALVVSAEFNQSAKEMERAIDDAKKGIQPALEDIERDFSHIPTATDRAMAATRAAMARGMGGVADAAEAGADDAADEAAKIPQKMADAMLAEQFSLTDATAQLVEFMKQAISPAQQMMQAKAFLASDAYRQGMASGIPAVVAKTIELRNRALATLNNLSGVAGGGSAFGGAWVNALVTRLKGDMWKVASALYGYKLMLIPSSPSPPKGPLHNAHLGALKIGLEWRKHLEQGIGPLNLPVPKVGGMPVGSMGLAGVGGLTMAGASVGGGGGGTTIVNFNSTWPPTPQQAREVAQIVDRELYFAKSGASRYPKG